MQTAPAANPSPDIDIHVLLESGALEQGLSLLIERFEAKIYRLCYSMLRDETQAEDVAQESWIRIWKALPNFDGRAALSTWVYAITRNRCLTAIERRGHNALQSADDIETLPDLADIVEIESGDIATSLRELVALLPERDRQILTLYYYEDRSVAEVANMLNRPVGTVKTLLHRARSTLNEELKLRGLDDPSAWWGERS